MFQVDLPLCHNVVGKSRVDCAPFGDHLCHVRGWIQRQMHNFLKWLIASSERSQRWLTAWPLRALSTWNQHQQCFGAPSPRSSCICCCYGIANCECTVAHYGMRDQSSGFLDPLQQNLNRLTSDATQRVRIIQSSSQRKR
jgi:hypothetical protein